MNSTVLGERIVVPPIGFDPSCRAISLPPLHLFRRLEDKQFSMMEAAFLRTGGLAIDNLVAHQLRRHEGQPVSVLARWIVRRQIVCLPWKSHTLVPLFQFNAQEMTLCPGISEILGELVGVFDDWEIAHWFSTPNAWLDDATPADAFARDSAAVHDAARADRFIAHG